ncbi:hypothetical protein EYC80_005947 [Monilinia laxa]|uniref:Uncharacterized protein n=1 Tax=Monilinia laxa TaxID=61186 RepID=A0A5N6KFT7_MONLA|nr:hypothetical protein EYC80_005947 [Monilinia laxa]
MCAERKGKKKKTLIVLGIYTRIVPSFLPAVNQTPYTPYSCWFASPYPTIISKQCLIPSKASVEHFELLFHISRSKEPNILNYLSDTFSHICVIIRGEGGMERGVVGYWYPDSEHVVECS